jgi:hypothetical protein
MSTIEQQLTDDQLNQYRVGLTAAHTLGRADVTGEDPDRWAWETYVRVIAHLSADDTIAPDVRLHMQREMRIARESESYRDWE